jgi:hypothetical protein
MADDVNVVNDVLEMPDISPWLDEIRSIALRHHRTAPLVDADDLESDMHVWWFEPKNTKYIVGYLTGENTELGARKLRRALSNRAYTFRLGEKAAREGFEVSDLYWYSKPLISELLPQVYEKHTTMPSAAPDGQPKGKSPASEGGNSLALIADVKRAKRRLPKEDRAFLKVAYHYQLDWDRVGEALDLLPDTARKRHERCISRMHRVLGGDRPWGLERFVGTRRAISNATAIAITRNAEG